MGLEILAKLRFFVILVIVCVQTQKRIIILIIEETIQGRKKDNDDIIEDSKSRRDKMRNKNRNFFLIDLEVVKLEDFSGKRVSYEKMNCRNGL